MKYSGQVHKMETLHQAPVQYYLRLENDLIDMNQLIGQKIQLSWLNQIRCIKCGKTTKTSFNQGFCYSCFMAAPESSECIIRPELCRAHLGEGRDPEWEERNHNQPHIVYLAATDITKVGITRETQVPTRWIDQGASSVIKVAETPNRYTAGLIEVALKEHFSDKTNWRNMLKNDIDESIDLTEEKWKLEEVLPSDMIDFFTEDDQIYTFDYPVLRYPSKIKSIDLEKEKNTEKVLCGIKGQYLLFEDDSVINIRKYTGYIIEISVLNP